MWKLLLTRLEIAIIVS